MDKNIKQDENDEPNPYQEDPAWLILHDKAMCLLADCRFSDKRSKEKAIEAINILKCIKDNITSGANYLQIRGLVCFPDLLEEYLNMFELLDDDYECMVARCIEKKNKKDNEDIDETWHAKSLNLLLTHCRPGCSLRLLPGKYKINHDLYNFAKECGLRDLYYENLISDKPTKIPYTHLGPSETEQSGKYYGFRYAYHLLIHGGVRKRELITWWKTCGTECTFDAAKEYYGLKNPQEVIQKMLQLK